ncbi:MAG: UDP-N-acetylmuramoyl-L-alanyl-D-glutamate--2,6-diaminopimelate ligase [Lachnospiraceae bacterium]|nr:UDP-N-acetylmuramoyl-L-alanyl-D-glutamate--2,6-diaminopimelate ligase [Lachnospiraceae bacterium]
MGRTLKELLTGLEYSISGNAETEVTALVYDSRKIEKGCAFVCIKGAAFDGHSKIKEAVEKGAAAVIAEDSNEFAAEYKNDADTGSTVMVYTEDTRRALGFLSAAWFGHPAEKLKTIGITGTKGKTTSTCLVREILENAGIKTGLIGTIEINTGSRVIPALNTTPESYLIQEYFDEMVRNGCKAVVMEVSSQGLMMNRVAGFTFDYGIFTNLSPDHIGPNEHKDFDDYLSCKKKLFSACRVGIFNADDPYFENISEGCTCSVETFGRSNSGADMSYDLTAYDAGLVNAGGMLGVSFKTMGMAELDAFIDMPGSFSVYNALTAIAVCVHFNVDNEAIIKGLRNVKVKGRIEMLDVSDEYTLMIDYAHNAMALNSLLVTLHEYEPGRLVTLFGCGGNRSRERRFEMGEVSGKLSDLTIITSDNPRNEEPLDIIADIETGIKKTDGEYVIVPDRKEAIAYAIDNARPGDVIVLAGKGHEDYQEIKGVKHHMDERELVAQVLAERGK